ncbi:MAG: phosphate ABC transporter permease PstA [Anaerolineae bacterium]|jgi:phosphate transport system permease protein|nr:phosphate ABC transporter permease PstA [Anaerolineae bacterium]MDX9830941.1 phosphate ABC transporter permease PstA [Anaerolineae bacterium]
MNRRRARLEETLMKVLMLASAAIVLGSLLLILGTVIWRGLPSLNLAMLTQTPKGGYYLGKEGGILNAIVGSLYLALGGTLLAMVGSLPIAIYLQLYAARSRRAELTRLALDVLWGVPSIVYGAFGFILMLWLGVRASLLGGIIALALLELPIMARGMDEAIAMVPAALKEASYALGATRFETALKVIVRQTGPALLTAVLLAFGRAIGDAASVLFTAGYTDRLPTSLMDPVASLPLAVFFQLGTPFPAVQDRAYASALVLTLIVLALSLASRRFARRLTKHVVR